MRGSTMGNITAVTKGLKGLMTTAVVVCSTLLMALISLQVKASDLSTLGEGMPHPWPFPWAIDCPVQWESLTGNYVLSDTDNKQYLDLDITILYKDGLKIVRVIRYDEYGSMISRGFAYVTEGSRSINLTLVPENRDVPVMRATIKLYYQGNDRACTYDNLVPILSLSIEHSTEVDARFKLIRIGINRK